MHKSIMKRLSKIFAFAILLSSLHAEHFYSDYTVGLTAAKDYKKLFIVIYDINYSDAIEYKKAIINDSSFYNKLSTEYELLFLDRQNSNYPKQYQTKFPLTTGQTYSAPAEAGRWTGGSLLAG